MIEMGFYFMTTFNWAIVGLGGIAANMADTLQARDNKIYAVASRSTAKAEAFAENYTVEKTYGSYSEVFADEKVDIVYIATPHNNHYEYIMEALHHNKHVLCEKAITVNSSELEEIIALAQEKKLFVSEAMTIFHMPLFKEIKRLINEGILGEMKMIQASFGSSKPYDVTSRFFNPDLAGGALLDIGTYAVSFARYFLSSQPHQIKTTMKQFETGVDEQSGILLQNNEGEIAVINLSIRAKTPKTAVLGGDKGYITITDYPRADKATFISTAGETTLIQAGSSADAMLYEVEDFEKLLLGNLENTLPLSKDVLDILTDVREQWGLVYSFEKK
ncbi:putative oxidoreductase, NAD-binding domain protein [Brochothrix thermosphacta]|nr:putative oxidoreductase, NAD-binding domain protein [Brochothrix thermosphacta]